MAPLSDVGAFPSSHWSLIARAGAADPTLARRALEELCQRYWYPLYVYVRRQATTHHEAEDVTQGFFAHLLENAVIARADPARGRFRTFLLSCCKNYLANHRRAGQTEKQGGRARILRMDFDSADSRYALEPADPSDPESLYRRRWAFTLLEETFAALEEEYRADGRTELFTRLQTTLTGDLSAQPYAAIAEAVGLTENAVKKTAQRLRARFGEQLRRRIADTVDDPEMVEDEIRDLFAAIR